MSIEDKEYILTSQAENQRLDDQFQLDWYHAASESDFFRYPDKGKLLDAGCGSCAFMSYIKQAFPDLEVSGCDLNVPDNSSKYVFQADITAQALPKSYDVITNRLVAHHLGVEGFAKAASIFYQGLNPGGQLFISDIDGLLLNIGTLNQFVLDTLRLLQQNFHGDTLTARYIPAILAEAGFTNIEYRVLTEDFQNHPMRMQEAEQWKQRFLNAKEFYQSVIGSEQTTQRFFDAYFEEFSNPNVAVFNNRFLIKATKP